MNGDLSPCCCSFIDNSAQQFASLGGFLFGYDQGVVSGVLTMESFGAKFPKIYLDSGFKGWFVSSLLLGTRRPNTLLFVKTCSN
jgi:hypothetical protein